MQPITHETTLFVDIPGLGRAAITAGTTFFNVRFGPRYVNTSTDLDVPMLVLFGKAYRETVDVSHDGMTCTVSSFTSLTDAARRRVVALLEDFMPGWVETTEAVALRNATVDYYNRLHVETVREDLARARNHVAQLETIAAQLRAAHPGEYVETYRTTYRLVPND